MKISEKYVTDHKSEPQKIEKATAEDKKRTMLSLSLSVSDKKALKKRSIKEGRTIASIVHDWIAEWKDEIEI